MFLYSKSRFLLLAGKLFCFEYRLFYFFQTDTDQSLNLFLPYFSIFQGFQIPPTDLQFNVILPGCSNLEKFSFFYDIFSRRHRLTPIFARPSQAKADWFILSQNYLLTSLNSTQENLISLRSSTQIIDEYSPSLSENAIKPKILPFRPVLKQRPNFIVFDSLLVSAISDYFFSDSTTRLSRNLALCQNLIERTHEL